MSKQPWSKGPWKLDLRPDRLTGEGVASACIIDKEGGVIAAFSGWDEMNEADAYLMAAAPTMYNALRAIYGKLDPGILASPEEIDWACDVAMDAMKKAKEQA